MKKNYFLRNKMQVTASIVLLTQLFCSVAFAQGIWTAVGTGLNAQALAMTEYNGELYIGKLNFSQPDEINKWNGTTMSGVGTGTNGPVGAFLVYNSDLYVSGGFTSAGGVSVNDVAKWNGSNWSPLGSQLDNFSINALAMYNNDLYAAGYGFNASGTAQSAFTIAKWTGSVWTSVGTGLQGGDVYALAVYNGELYASGTFTNAGSIVVNHIAKWNGTNWSALGTGTNSGTAVYGLAVYGNELYAGGSFTSIDGIAINCLAKWNDTTWANVGSSNGTNNTVIALTAYNNELYVGGAFSTAGGIAANHIAKWNGSTWSTFGSGIGTSGSTADQIWSITPYNNSIYAAGIFTQAGGVAANNIARWTEATVVDENSDDKNSLLIYPNPCSDFLKIQMDKNQKLQVEIYSVPGIKILSAQFESNTSIPVNDIASGIYIIKIYSEEKCVIRKKIQVFR